MRHLLLSITLMASLASCSYDNHLAGFETVSGKGKPLKIVTRTLTTHSANFIQEFKEGSEIGLLITSEEDGGLYDRNSDYINVKAKAYLTDDKIAWQQMPEVLLTPAPAIVYAYYPYQSQMNLGTASIPVNISPDASQTSDYMYGTQAPGQKAVNNTSPMVLLNMDHALSLISFELNLEDAANATYHLSSLQLGNKAGGTALACKGTMDIRTGEITATACCNIATRLNPEHPVRLTEDWSEPLQIKVVPTSIPITEGDIEALFIINGTSYKYKLPANTLWEKRHKYLYRLTFRRKSLVLKKRSVTDWIQGNREEDTKNLKH